MPDGTYTITHSSGSFTNIAVDSNAAAVTGLVQGTYNNIQITSAGCTSATGTSATLTDPTSPTLVATGVNPTVCGGNGSIDLVLTNVPDGIYTIDYDGGQFTNVTVTANAASITATQGVYNNIFITIGGCTSALGQNVVLADPTIQTIAVNASTSDPATCSGNG